MKERKCQSKLREGLTLETVSKSGQLVEKVSIEVSQLSVVEGIVLAGIALLKELIQGLEYKTRAFTVQFLERFFCLLIRYTDSPFLQ